MNEIPEGYIAVPESAWHELVQYELRCQELAATVEALRDTCSYWINQAKPSGDCSKSEYNAWLALGYQSNAMTKPAKQHLAEIRAQAVEDFIQFMYSQDNCQLCNSSLDIASKYAESILKGELK